MTAVAADSGPDPKLAWTRLLVAAALSAALHLALLIGLPVNPTGGTPGKASMIEARLDKALVETATDTPPAPDLSPTPDPAAAIAHEDPLAAPEPRKPGAPEPKAAAEPSSPHAGVELPLIRDPTYYTVKELLPFLPSPLPESKEYMEAAVARLGVRVRVLLLIDEFGIVKDASVLDAEPPEHAEAVRAVFMALRFSPGLMNGRAVKARVVINARPLAEDPGVSSVR